MSPFSSLQLWPCKSEQLPQEQVEQAKVIREPIKDKLITILSGNHDRVLWKFGDHVEGICDYFGIPYGTATAKITINDKKGNLMYKHFAMHGARSIRSTADDPTRRKSNMELSLKRSMKFKAGDCAVMTKGHTHRILVAEPIKELYLTDDNGKIKQHYTGSGQNESYIHPDSRWYGNTGSFLKLYGIGHSGYAEIFEYDPMELGWLILRIRGKQIVSLDPFYLNI